MTSRSPRHALIAVCLLALAAAGCGSPEGPAARDEALAPPVEALQARSGRLPGRDRVSGVVRASNQVAVRSEITARVTAVLVRGGETVGAGELLARLSDDELRERLAQARASLRLAEAEAAEARAEEAEAEAEASRVRRLAEEAIVSVLEADTWAARVDAARARTAQAEARTQRARAELEEARAALARTEVRAPVGGRVDRRAAEVGLLATPSTELFVVGDPERLIVEVPLTEEALGRVAEGAPVRIRPRGGEGDGIEARLTRISPFLRPESFSTIGEIELDNARRLLRPGHFVTVDLLHGDDEAFTLLPAAAAWEDPLTGRATVWVVSGAAGLDPSGRELGSEPRLAERRPVTVRGEGDGLFGVAEVEPGEWVVTLGQHLLQGADAAGEGGPDGRAEARVRPADWDRVLALQSLQREDLLRRFLEKQRRAAREFGARIPPDPEEAERVLSSAGGEGR